MAFQAGGPVRGRLFYDRDEILHELSIGVKNLKEGARQNFALVGPRLIGKSSILEVLSERLKREEIETIYLDCWKIYPSNLQGFLETFAETSLKSISRALGWTTRARSKIGGAIKGTISAILDLTRSVGVAVEDFLKVWVDFRERRVDIGELMRKTLEYPEQVAEKHDRFLVVILDEFQELHKYGVDFVKFLSATIYRQRRVCYIVSGSAVTLMRRVLEDRRSPFYGRFAVKWIGPLPKRDARKLLIDGFKGERIASSEEAIAEIMRMTGCHPYYLQKLGQACLDLAARKKHLKISIDTVAEAYDLMLSDLSFHFEEELRKFEPRYRDILATLAVYGAKMPTQIAAKLGVRAGEVSPYLKRLIETQVVEKSKAGYELMDPIFRDWLKRYYQM
ncbi:MAG: ATP-binding protein [Hadesarchaea archaeon]|nr:ATP-binding protein [Hadesarchaea archaeon]